MDQMDKVERGGRSRKVLFVFIPLGFVILVGILWLSGFFISEEADRGPNDVPVGVPAPDPEGLPEQ